jgi:hypothetical protein
MNASMNIHRAQSIEVTPKIFDTFTATEIRVTAADGSVVCIDVCADADPLVITMLPPSDYRKEAA